MGEGGRGFGLLLRCYAPARLSDSESYSESVCRFEWLETCLAECSQGRELDVRTGDTASPPPFVCPSLEAPGLLGTTKGKGRQRTALQRSTDKASAERTSLQVNSQEQLVGNWGQLRFPTVNPQLLHNKDMKCYSF